METSDQEFLKRREIYFQDPHPDPHQAQTAYQLFEALDCVSEVSLLGDSGLSILYDVRGACLQDLESALLELGFHLENNLFMRIKRALYYYTEETQRTNLGIAKDQNQSTQEIFINRYQRIQHGCRDTRPGHWRKYL